MAFLLRSQPYIDYHSFIVTQAANFIIIDLEYQGDVVDTYLYQVVGGVESLLDLNGYIDDFTNSRISRSLDPGTYKKGASTYYTGNTGDYRLHIRQGSVLLRICLTGGRHNGQHLHDMDLDGLRIY